MFPTNPKDYTATLRKQFRKYLVTIDQRVAKHGRILFYDDKFRLVSRSLITENDQVNRKISQGWSFGLQKHGMKYLILNEDQSRFV